MKKMSLSCILMCQIIYYFIETKNLKFNIITMNLQRTLLLFFIIVIPLEAVKYDKLKPNVLYDRAVKYLDNENFPKALKALKTYTKSQPNDADGWNLYGYTSRKMGKFDKAKIYYDRALEIDPNHKGALEYQGELFIQTNRIDLAYQNLNKLDELCPNSCFELEQLKESLLKYK